MQLKHSCKTLASQNISPSKTSPLATGRGTPVQPERRKEVQYHIYSSRLGLIRCISET